jgi:hypothetical protein
MSRINLRRVPKIFIFSLVTPGLLLGTASCVPDGESDLLQSLWEQTDSIGGEMSFTTKDGETVTVTITKNSDGVEVNEAENNPMEQEDKLCEDKTTDTPDLNDILPCLNSIEDVFKTLGVWEKAAELREQDFSWSHVAAELGYTEDTMYGHLQEIIKQRLHHSWELGLISDEKYEYKLKYYNELALKWVGKIFADLNPATTATLNDFLPTLNSIEDVFKTLGVWEKAAELRKLGHSWSHVATEIGYTEDTMYGHLYEIIKHNLYHAWELGLISDEKYEYKLKYYGDLALKWVGKIFADVNQTTSATLEDYLPSLNSIEDIFKTLGVWEDADVLYDQVQSWSKVAGELGYTADAMYSKLKGIIEKDLHQAKVEGLITYEQYKNKIGYYNEIALKGVGEVFSS